ncbi:phosphate/phosphite/phosphonate ABC transporter binding protein [Cohaesibacter sp. ES.047]|uniref:phosphate/phosphite/phosphonate ABC transporter substrate-binding protein n=1 Tax=Cohaesibacter sp. ES.047 TaxID=1798205 RepID=UPI000BB70379|nr:PhnD/SsuA/transferrin family substrate-binding protein [Cohaesibacter sp. ES.047]SNY91816.1 phosphate/phosphite/phosphonate ABC transporter binding protein [Cohaesibacter sp. ES.047]
MFKTHASATAVLKEKGSRALFLLVLLVLGLTALTPRVKAQDVVESRELGDLVAPAPERASPDTGMNTRTDADINGEPIVDLTGAPEQTLPSSIETLGEALTQSSDNQIELIDNTHTLRIGLMAERGPSYLQRRIKPFRDYLERELSRPVEIIAFTDMKAMMGAQTSKQIDYATYPAGAFAMAQAACGCLLPLVAPVSQSAPEGIYILMIVRAQSGIKSLADMTGRSLALSSRSGALPYHMALSELQRAGLDPNRDLAVVYSRDTPQEALSLLQKGEVDAALVWSSTQYSQRLFDSPGAVSAFLEERKANTGTTQRPDFISIWSSPAIPAGPHVVHADMPKQDRADLITALTAMNTKDPAAYDAIELYHDGGFRRVSVDDYDPIVKIATAK